MFVMGVFVGNKRTSALAFCEQSFGFSPTSFQMIFGLPTNTLSLSRSEIDSNDKCEFDDCISI